MTKTPEFIQGEMVTGSYQNILDHEGHRLVATTYGFGPPDNGAIECEKCGCIVVDFNYKAPKKPRRRKKK